MIVIRACRDGILPVSIEEASILEVGRPVAVVLFHLLFARALPNLVETVGLEKFLVPGEVVAFACGCAPGPALQVVKFSGGGGVVAGALEGPGESGVLGAELPRHAPQTDLVGVPAGQEGSAGGLADGADALAGRENCALRCDPIKVWGGEATAWPKADRVGPELIGKDKKDIGGGAQVS
jgi:hypothetical protein